MPVKIKIWLFVALPILLTLSLWYRIASQSIIPPGYLVAIIQVSGLIALNIFALVLIISSRLPFLTKIFGSYDKVYFWHKFLGIAAFSFASLHFLALDIKYISQDGLVGYLQFLFNLNQWQVLVGLVAFIGISILILLTYISRLPYHIWKMTHEWMGFFFILGGIHSFLVDSTIKNNPTLFVLLLIISLIGLFSFIYIRFLWRWFPFRYKYQVVNNIARYQINDLILQPINPQNKMQFLPAQFVFASFEGNQAISNEPHPYTISSSPLENNIRLSIKDLGDYTSKIKNIQVGTQIILNGPYGNFADSTLITKKPATLIAGGIGITPFLGILRHLAITGSNQNVDLFYLIRNEQEAVYLVELQELEKKIGNNIRIIPFYSDVQNRFFGFEELKQYLEYIGNFDTRQFLICGPTPMMDNMIDSLLKLGVKNRQIHIEDFSFKK